MTDGRPILGSLYVYAPNDVAPVVFTVLFALSAVGHIWQCRRYNDRHLTGVQAFCAVLYTIAYALREYGAFNYLYSTPNLACFIISEVFIYISPPLLELANYHILARIFFYVPHEATIPPNMVFALFGGFVAIVEGLNGVGVGFISNPSSSPSKQEIGSHLTIASLALQIVNIMTCYSLAIIFHWRCSKTKTASAAITAPLLALYASMAMILTRSVFRLVQNSGDVALDIYDYPALEKLTPLRRYEWYFYVFEAAPMLVSSIVWNVWHPRRYLPENPCLHLDRDGVTLVGRLDREEKRSVMQRTGNVLSFGMLFQAKKRAPEMLEEA